MNLSTSNATALIRARGLTKTFGERTAVDAINFDVRDGEFFGFLGPNGAGKTTTMRMIAGVSPRTSGTLEIFGQDPDLHGSEIRARIGVVHQQETLDMELTVRENLLIFGRFFGMDRDKRVRLLIDVGTNCEIVLSNGDTILTTAAPAGPAFEAASIACGMRAADGAIEVVQVTDDGIKLGVIGDVEPVGICGSGLVDAVYVLHKAKLIDDTQVSGSF